MKRQIPDMSRIPGGCIAHGEFPTIARNPSLLVDVTNFGDGVVYLGHLLTAGSTRALRERYEAQGTFAPVTVQGLAPGQEIQGLGNQVGSHRITCWDPAFGEALWPLIQPFLASSRIMTDLSFTDWWQRDAAQQVADIHPKHRHWRPVGVSPMARYMRYDQGGLHFAHYDAGYIYPGGKRRTLMSGVLYLTTNGTGSTDFIQDDQDGVSVWERNHADWTRPVEPREVLASYLPVEGSVLLFDHRLCHAVSQYLPRKGEGSRIIIRFDVEFEACGSY